MKSPTPKSKPARATTAKPVTVKAKAQTPDKIALGTLAFGEVMPICDSKAAFVVTSTTIDGKYEGYLCRANGERLERFRASGVDEIEARASALLNKGAL